MIISLALLLPDYIHQFYPDILGMKMLLSELVHAEKLATTFT